MQWIEIAGYTGAFFTAVNFLPQVVKAYQTKEVKDLSAFTLILIFLGQSVWIIYGFGKDLWPVIVSNCCLLFLSIILLIQKNYYARKQQKKSRN